jgi:hypothetical protein
VNRSRTATGYGPWRPTLSRLFFLLPPPPKLAPFDPSILYCVHSNPSPSISDPSAIKPVTCLPSGYNLPLSPFANPIRLLLVARLRAEIIYPIRSMDGERSAEVRIWNSHHNIIGLIGLDRPSASNIISPDSLKSTQE